MPEKIRKLKTVWEKRNIFNQFAIYIKVKSDRRRVAETFKRGCIYGMHDSVCCGDIINGISQFTDFTIPQLANYMTFHRDRIVE